MPASKADIIARLQREILSLQGFKPITNGNASDLGLGPIRSAFRDSKFPVGAIHEFLCSGREEISATGGFISGLLSTLMKNGGAALWINSSRNVFPPGLTLFGIEPHKILFIELHKEKDVLWAMEESLKCEGLAAVVGEVNQLSFMASRRLQLAVEQSRVTGFVLRKQDSNINITSCVTRWKISHLPSVSENELPGVGFPRWNVELIKVRNGKPGTWEIEWRGKRFRHASSLRVIRRDEQKKTG